MTVSATETDRNDYVAAAGQTIFPYTFRIFEAEDLKVYQNGTLLTITTDYAVSNVDAAGGGNVTLVVGATALDEIAILSDIAPTQDADYVENDSFSAETHERALDKLTRLHQQQVEQIRRSGKFAEYLALAGPLFPEPVIGSFLRWLSIAPPVLENVVVTPDTGIALPLSTAEGGTGADFSTDSGFPELTAGAFSFLSAAAFRAAIGAITLADVPTSKLPWCAPNGLTVSNSVSDPTNDLDIAAGDVNSDEADPEDRVTLYLAAGLTKRIDATWVAGTGNGGRASSQALADGTWFVFICEFPGSVIDVGYDTSPIGANLIADHGATHVRMILPVLRESSALVPIVHSGNHVWRSIPVQDYFANNPGTNEVLVTLSVPLGIKVVPIITVGVTSIASASTSLLVTGPAQTNSVPTATLESVEVRANEWGFFAPRLLTDTSGRIRLRLSASDANRFVQVHTHGWIYPVS